MLLIYKNGKNKLIFNMKKIEIVIIGVGKFGSTIIQRLEKLYVNKAKVILIDKDENSLKKHSNFADKIYIGDSTDENFMKSISIENADVFVLGMGEDIQSSVLTSSLIINNFKSGRIIAKVLNEQHKEILNKIGVKDTIHPEEAAARRAVLKIFNPFTLLNSETEIIELDEKISIIRKTINNEQWKNKKIMELGLPNTIKILLIYRNKKVIIASGETIIKENDEILLMGENELLSKMETDW